MNLMLAGVFFAAVWQAPGVKQGLGPAETLLKQKAAAMERSVVRCIAEGV